MTITKTKLQELVQEDYTYVGDYHNVTKSEIEDIIDMIDDDMEYADFNEVYDALQYNGRITEYADSSAPIYNADIAEWFAGNYSAVNDYIEEFGVERESTQNSDIMRLITCAWVFSYDRDLSEALRVLCEEVEEMEGEEAII